MSQPNQKLSVHISEIPLDVTRQEVINQIKMLLQMPPHEMIKGGNFMRARDGIPYNWGVFEVNNDDQFNRLINQFRFINTSNRHPAIKSRLLPNDKEFIKQQIANPDKNICIKKLPEDIDHDTLYALCSKYGEVASCKVSKTFLEEGNTFKSNHYGYASYISPEDATKGIEGINAEDNEMVGEKYDKTNKNATPQNNLYVKNLPINYDDEGLRKMFETFGNISSCKVMRDDSSGSSKGFGFVCFKEYQDAQQAKQLDGHVFPGQDEKLYVGDAIKKEVREKALKKSLARQNLYIRNFGVETTEEQLKEFFSSYGEVKNVRIMTTDNPNPAPGKPTKISKNFGFVCFKDQLAAAQVMSKQPITYNGNTLFVSYYETKHDRQNVLAKQFNSTGSASPFPGGSNEISQLFQQFFQP